MKNVFFFLMFNIRFFLLNTTSIFCIAEKVSYLGQILSINPENQQEGFSFAFLCTPPMCISP